MADIEDIPDDLFAEAQATSKPKTPRQRAQKAKGREPAKPPENGLLEAIKFVSLCQTKSGEAAVTHCELEGGWLCAAKGPLTMGFPVEEDLDTTPNTYGLLDAMKAATGDLSLTQLADGSLSVVSGDLRTIVPACDRDAVTILPPDNPVAVIDGRVLDALDLCMGVVNERSYFAKYAAICLQADTAVATNGACFIEAWHGIDLPPNLLLPKRAIQVLKRCKRAPTGLGFSNNSVTFWFEGKAFLRTAVYKDDYPEYLHLFERESVLKDIPQHLFDAMIQVGKSNNQGYVYFRDGEIVAEFEGDLTTAYKLGDFPAHVGFDSNLVKHINKWGKRYALDETDGGYILHVYGDTARAVVSSLTKEHDRSYRNEMENEAVQNAEQVRDAIANDYDNEIPF